MTLKIDNSIKEKAILLRSQGMSYANILAALSQYGATEWWVKSVTKGVSKRPTPTQEAVRTIYSLTSPVGSISNAEFYAVCNQFGVGDTRSSRDYIKAEVMNLAKKEGKEVVFTPDWLSNTAPRASMNRLMELASELFESVEDHVYAYMQDYPEASYAAVRKELLSLAIPGHSRVPVEARCDYIEGVVNHLTQAQEEFVRNEARAIAEELENDEGSRAS